MPRLFLGNFDFEHRLAAPRRERSARQDRINAELAPSWLAIACDGDYLWTPQPIDARFFEQAAASGLPRVVPVVSLAEVPGKVECVPWGWTDDIRQLCDRHGWVRHDPPPQGVRTGNSRRFSLALEREWGVGLDGAVEAASLQDVEQRAARQGPRGWVIKSEFGMSGRERILGRGGLTDAQRNWISRRIDSGDALIFEPWVDRLEELGIQIEIPRDGPPRLIGLTTLLVDDSGQYCGSRFAARQSGGEPIPAAWAGGVDVAMTAAQRLRELGYFGPLGIDAMRYRSPDGTERIRPLQDINARWTMGRLALGWQRLLRPGESGDWLMGPRPLQESSLRGQFGPGRAVRVFPTEIGGQPGRDSVVWIEGPDSGQVTGTRSHPC